MRCRLLCAGSLLLLLSASILAETPDDLVLARRLWDEAVAAVERGASFRASMIESLTEELDSKGKVVSSERAVHGLTYASGSAVPESRLLRSEKDGKDNSEERRKAEEQARGKSGRSDQNGQSYSATPLDRESQANISLLSLRLEGEYAVVAYDLAAQPQSYTGTVRISRSQGYPIEIVQAFKKKPLFVQAMEIRIMYNPPLDRDGPAATIASADFSAEATILFIKKIVRGSLKFQSYAPAS